MKTLIKFLAGALVATVLMFASAPRADDILHSTLTSADGGVVSTTISQGQYMLNARDVVQHYKVCNSSTCSADYSSAPIRADEKMDIWVANDKTHISMWPEAVSPDGGPARLFIYRVSPPTLPRTGP